MSGLSRYLVSVTAGARDGKRFAVVDRQGGLGARRVSWHRTFREAQAEARRLNAQERSS